jgi:hypothetical protein
MHPRTIVRGAAVAACVVALARPAAAQQQGEFESWQVPGWSFTPGLSIGIERDTNVALAAPGDLAPADADSLFGIEPFGSLEFLSRRTEFSGGYHGYVRRYVEIEELNGFDHRFQAQLRHQASKRVLILARSDYADVPTTDEVLLNGGLPFSRTGSQSAYIAGGVEALLTKFTSLKSKYELSWIDFENKETVLTGGWVNGVRTDVEHRISARASVGAEYSIRFADLNEGTRSMRFHDVGGIASYALGPNTTLSGAAGYSHLADLNLGETRSAPYFRFGVIQRVRTSSAGISYERSFVPAFGFGGTNESQELRAFVHMPIPSNRTYLQATGSWRRSVPYLASDLELHSFLTRATVGYALARWFRVEGFHAFSRQDTVVTGGEINRHRIGAQLVISQPMRLQ